MSLDTKFDELLDFPCLFSFKVIGTASADLQGNIVAVTQRHIPGDYSPRSRKSSKGNYDSISINVTVQDKIEIETLYVAYGNIPGVIRVL